jgi:hypothetical protein
VPTRSDFGDLPLLRTITNTFGAAVWFNAIVVLTHASTAPPDAPNGQPMSYEMYVQQRSHIVQQTIRQAAGDLRLMVRLAVQVYRPPAHLTHHACQNPVALAENHPAGRKNRENESVLPNGQVRVLLLTPRLAIICDADRALDGADLEAAAAAPLLRVQDPDRGQCAAEPAGVWSALACSRRRRAHFAVPAQDNTAARQMNQRQKVPPLPFLLSSLITSRPPRKASRGRAQRAPYPRLLILIPHAPQAYVDEDGYPPDDGEQEQFPQEESKQARRRNSRDLRLSCT